MNRENFIKIIPKPTNEDVILYDISLKDLIDVDVLKEYYKLLPIFKEEKNKLAKLKKEIDQYSNIINQTFLLNPSWSEETYLQKLQDDMRTYSISYGNIKKKEDEIKILQKKIEAINDKIVVQQAKEEKENEIRIANIINNIEENKIDIKKNKDTIGIYRDNLKKIEEQIRNSKSDLKMLKTSMQQLLNGKYICCCCGQKIKKDSTNQIIDKITLNIQKKDSEITTMSDEKNKIKNTLDYFKDELLKNNISLKNNLNFKQNYKKMYIKKSIEILRLEASKSECLEKITNLNNELKNEPYINSKKFLELKNTIEKYKVSLENLKKIKSIKGTVGKQVSMYKRKQTEVKEMEKTINKYLTFLNIYYKIYEQKASQYAGPDYKIKLFEIKNCEIINILNIIYKGVEYSQLSKTNKEIVDENLIKKFNSDF